MTITPVTVAQFTTALAKLETTNQAKITGSTEGTITGHGVTAKYRYDAHAQTLTVDIVHHPFYIPVSAIEAQLRAALTAAA
jgi:hypothetical protein